MHMKKRKICQSCVGSTNRHSNAPFCTLEAGSASSLVFRIRMNHVYSRCFQFIIRCAKVGLYGFIQFSVTSWSWIDAILLCRTIVLVVMLMELDIVKSLSCFYLI